MAVIANRLDDSFYLEDKEKTRAIRRTYLGDEKSGHLFCSVSRLGRKKSGLPFKGNPVSERKATFFISGIASGGRQYEKRIGNTGRAYGT